MQVAFRYKKTAYKAIFLFLLMLSLSVFSAVSAAAEDDSLALIRRYVQQVPPLTAYGKDVRAMVWHRSQAYKMLADGTLMETSRWLIYSESPLSGQRSSWKIASAGDEKLEITEAAVYDPVEFKLIATLYPKKVNSQGMHWYEIDVPPLDVPHVLSICYKKECPGKWNVDDVVPIDLDLPQWRVLVTVSVPHNSSLTWALGGDNQVEPKLTIGAEDSYSWEFINRPALAGFDLKDDGGSYIAFSMRNGWLNAIKPLEDWAGSLRSVVPDAVNKALNRGDKSKSGKEILDWAKDKKLIIDGPELYSLRRNAESMPKEGPWTVWERNVLLGHWLSMAGWDVRVNWVPLFVPKESVPGTPCMIARPVLEVKMPGSSAYKFLDLGGSLTEGNAIPDSLWGRTLCYYDGTDIKFKQLSSGNVADHRLRAKWNLQLSDSGKVEGTLELTFGGAWPYIIFGKDGDFSKMSSIVRLYPSQLGVKWEDLKVSVKSNEVTMTCPVSGLLGIADGDRMLLRTPSIAFGGLSVLDALEVGSKLRLPFLIEEISTIKLPQGHQVLSMPLLSSKLNGKIKWEQTIDEKSRGRIVEAKYRFLVDETSMDEETLSSLRAGLKALQQWNNMAIPIRKR